MGAASLVISSLRDGEQRHLGTRAVGTAAVGISGLWDRSDDDERGEGGVSAQAHSISMSRGEVGGVHAHARGN